MMAIGSMVPPDLADPEIAEYVRRQQIAGTWATPAVRSLEMLRNAASAVNPLGPTMQGYADTVLNYITGARARELEAQPGPKQSGALLPIMSNAQGQMWLSPNAGIPGSVLRGMTLAGDVRTGKTRIPHFLDVPQEEMVETPVVNRTAAPDPNSLAARVGLKIPSMQATTLDEGMSQVGDLIGLVAGGGIPGAQAGAVGAAGGGLRHGVSKVVLPKPIEEMTSVINPTTARPETVISPADLQGSRLVPLMGDRTRSGGDLVQVNGYPFENPVPLQGGATFMRDNDAAWASNAAPAKKLQNAVVAEGADAPVMGVHTAMGERSGDFSHMTAGALVEMTKQAKVPRAGKQLFDQEMKNRGVVDWPGVGSSKLADYLNEPGRGEVRKLFTQQMDTARYQKMGFPSVAEARVATTDPRLLNEQFGASGLTVARMDPEGALSPSAHRTYDTDIPGQYQGGLPAPVPFDVMFPKMSESLKGYVAQLDAGSYQPRMDYLMQRPPRGTPRSEVADQQWVDSVSKHLEGRGFTLGSGAVDETGQLRAQGANAGLHSMVERAVEQTPQRQMTGDQWLGTIANKPGVKGDELDATGLRSFLQERKGQPVTREEVADHLAQNRVTLKEVRRNADRRDDPDGPRPKYEDWQIAGGDNYRELLLTMPPKRTPGLDDAFVRVSEARRRSADTMERYKFEAEFGRDPAIIQQAKDDWIAAGKEERAARDAFKELDGKRAPEFESRHWDEPNVLVHMRAHDREIGGKPSLHLEEIQSDWHQAGRKAGYAPGGGPSKKRVDDAQRQSSDDYIALELAIRRDPALRREMPDIEMNHYTRDTAVNHVREFADQPDKLNPAVSPEIAQMGRNLNRSLQEYTELSAAFQAAKRGVPDAPFKKTWHELALKKALVEAAEKGYERLSWTPGAAQAERYDLSKQLNSITVTVPHGPDGGRAWWPEGRNQELPGSIMTDKDGTITKANSVYGDVVGKNISDVLGKDIAEKGLAATKETKLSGLDLKVGGEGMIGFYDQMVPKALEKLLKPWGAKVQQAEPTKEAFAVFRDGVQVSEDFPTSRAAREWGRNNEEQVRAGTTGRITVRQSSEDLPGLPYVEITPQMRADIAERGFSLFTGGRDAPTTQGAAAGLRAAEQRGFSEGATAEATGAAGAAGDGGRGLASRARSVAEAEAQAARVAAGTEPLAGLPRKPLNFGGDHYVPGPIGSIRKIAEDYMAGTGRAYEPPKQYHPLDKDHSTAIAKAFDEMKHAPDDPAVKASYDALIDETLAQFQAIKKSGLKIEFIKPGMDDPYFASPRLAAMDVADNNHLWVFPTESGFGTVSKISDNPMLRPTDEVIDGHKMVANDVFRIVHDYFGHLKEGHGFRAAGEDNAWRAHSAMYSDLARPAMTSETRGQNSWVNYGPHGEKNRTATAADTVYADQKVGIMPEWTMRDRGSQPPVLAYHGTPHKHGKFDSKYLGTGEGEEVYGRGHYFAQAEDTAKHYRDILSKQKEVLQFQGKPVDTVWNEGIREIWGDYIKTLPKGQREDFVDVMSSLSQVDRMQHVPHVVQSLSPEQRKVFDKWVMPHLMETESSPGHLYQVALDINPDHLLNWDKIFREQTPHVRDAMMPDMLTTAQRAKDASEKLLARPPRDLRNASPLARARQETDRQKWAENLRKSTEQMADETPGSVAYRSLGLPALDAKEAYGKATKRALEVGVPGIKYLDQASRPDVYQGPGGWFADVGEKTVGPYKKQATALRNAEKLGTSNYVVFDDKLIRILRRYGILLPGAAAGAELIGGFGSLAPPREERM